MRIAMIGTGYVGLVTGTCFAETGNDVICIDCDQEKIQQLRNGQVPIYEPGLSELVHRNVTAGRLEFSTQMADIRGCDLVFIAVGTPGSDDGSVDLTAFWNAVDSIAEHLDPHAIVVIKSTVPVGTNRTVAQRLRQLTGRHVDVVSNPEFLKEGTAIEDFMKPDRIIIGLRRQELLPVFQDLYAPYLRTDKPLLHMSPESAEMTKYVANAMLATKISFINEMANICEKTGADINDVRRGIGHDQRIGFAFLFPGVGYGGSCFPKDVKALASVAKAHGVEPRILEAVDRVNEKQKETLFTKMLAHFCDGLQGKTIAIWGLSFKPGTDDIREAPSLVLIRRLLEHGAVVRVHDPVAINNVRRLFGDQLIYCDHPEQAIEGADALAIVTEWKQFVHPDFARIRMRMRQPVIFDGRNLYEPAKMKQAGFYYYSVGRTPVVPDEVSSGIEQGESFAS